MDSQLEFGLSDDRAEAPKAVRKRDGSIRAKDMKSVQWYALEHTLKINATNIWPNFGFTDRDGKEVLVHIDDITEAYANFKKSTHGRKQNA